MSEIKGGGRAQLTQEAEESIVSLLYDLRDHRNPLLTNSAQLVASETVDQNSKTSDKKLYGDLNDHDRKRERRRFLKNLQKCYDHQVLSHKLNQTPNSAAPLQSTFTASKDSSPLLPAQDCDVSHASGKIRIQLVEMIFKEKKDKPKKDDKNKSSKKEKASKTCWKEGDKKIMVLPRDTTVKKLMDLCKGKLKMKNPSRIFIVEKESKLEMDLIHDLRGLKDGVTVRATSHVAIKTNEERGEQSRTKNDGEEDFVLVDPLENIKKAYRLSSLKRSKKHKLFTNDRFLPFSGAIGQLEVLSKSREKLPTAKYRAQILRSLDSSRVIVISGATGCGYVFSHFSCYIQKPFCRSP